MRFLPVVFFILFVGYGASAQTTASLWNTDLTTALQQAKASNKPVLAVFSGSDWCKPCIMLKQEVFDQPEFQQYAQSRYVLARFDFPRSKKNKLPAPQLIRNEAAAAQLNPEVSFALVVLLSPEGKVLARSGYRPGGPAAYDAYLTQLTTKK
jgi:thioredoxin-related protein